MPKYVCTQCKTEYDTMTPDGFCTNQPDCEYGTGWLREVSSGATASEEEPNTLSPLGFEREVGLCVLMMDGSLSMNEPAFPGSDYPGNRYKLVSMNAAGGIWALSTLTNVEDAFIALCVFAGEPKLVWIKNVKQIIEEYGSPEVFDEAIHDILKTETPDPKFTNINEAISLAHRITQAFNKGDLSEFGGEADFKPVVHQVVRPGADGEEFINIANARVLIYTDGEHNVTAAIKNPFAEDEQSVLMSAFIGEESSKGVKQMQSIANVCPKHNPATGFFLIDSPERVQTLKGLFRMASGASGFCPSCLIVEQTIVEEEPATPEDSLIEEGQESTTEPDTVDSLPPQTDAMPEEPLDEDDSPASIEPLADPEK